MKMADIAVLGHGVVGSGVLEVLLSHGDSITRRAKEAIRVRSSPTRRSLPRTLTAFCRTRRSAL